MHQPQDFEDFYRRQHRQIIAVLHAYCGDPALAEELTQEAFARAGRHWERVRAMQSPGGWLHRVALNGANSHFRRRRAERRAMSRHGESTAVSWPEDDDALTVRAAVAQLPRRQRIAVALYYFADLPVVEVAGVMGVPENTAKSLLHRARQALQALLDPAPRLEEDVDVH